MDVKELRIGNIVRIEHQESVQDEYCITGYDLYKMDDGTDIEGTEILGIPLTEDLLKRFGFVYKDGHWRNGVITLNYITTDEWFEFEFCFPFTHWLKNNLKHVHTLQNLYYALCGQELVDLEV